MRVVDGPCWWIKQDTKWINTNSVREKCVCKPPPPKKNNWVHVVVDVSSRLVLTLLSLMSLTGGHHSPLADTLPDPVGRHPPGLAALLGLGQRVCGRGGVVVLHQVAVVRHKVAPQLVEVLNGGGQEELHPAEDVQQHLEGQRTRPPNSVNG